MTSILPEQLKEFQSGADLAVGNASEFFDALITETDERLLVSIFNAWNRKGIAGDEIYLIANIMRERCKRVVSRHKTFVDIVGTGGSKVKTFNISTAAAFVVAGGGVPVAKHGNKAATSNSGSADVLAALGIQPAIDAVTAERCLNDIGICFMFAPNFHRLSPILAKVRRGLGFPTIFNCVGPLCNPAGAPHQLIGVWDKQLVPKMANALARLRTKKSWVVHGEEGMDEISISGPTFVAEVDGENVRTFELSPRDFFIEPISLNGLRAKTPDESAMMIREVLKFKQRESAAESVVLANAMAAFYIAGYGESLQDTFGFAFDSIRNGHALKKLNALAAAVSL